MNAITPKIIGICGYPKHGKSTAQRFLERLGVEARDDADELRKRACKEFGLTWEQVTTQEGKLQLVEAFGRTMTVREALGEFGQVYGERPFGPNYWIELALQQLRDDRVEHPVSFGSLRRSQASAVKYAGGFVIAIQDPRRPMSDHYFDEYDYDFVDVMIFNDSTIEDLETRVLMVASTYLKVDRDQAGNALFGEAVYSELKRMGRDTHAA